MVGVLGSDCRADLVDHVPHVAGIERARSPGGRSHADDGDFGGINRVLTVKSRPQQAALLRRPQQIFDSRLDDGSNAAVEGLDFLLLDVDADDGVSLLCQGCGRYRTYVTEAEDADVHEWAARRKVVW